MIKKICHITFPALDMKGTVDFFENVLGLKKTDEWGNYAIFDVGGVEFAFGLNEKFQLYLLVDDADKAYKALKEKGVNFVTEPKDQFWGGRTAEFVNPNGNKFILESFKKQA